MMRACAVALGTISALLLAPTADAQRYNPHQTQINIQYHETVPAGGDPAPVLVKILDRIRQDCELIGKAFARHCAITQININVNATYGGEISGMQHVNANANIVLPPEPPAPAVPTSPPGAPSPPSGPTR